MNLTKQRNGILEIYRLIIIFWVLFHHEFFFFYNNGNVFSRASLAADFFFVISGFFLLRSMKKLKDEPLSQGLKKLLASRTKPLLFSVCFITAFNVICIAAFVREDILGTSFFIFRYWWYLLYMLVAAVIFYCVYKKLKTERSFSIFLIVLTIFCAVLYYPIDQCDILMGVLTYILRAFGCMAAGMLVAYIPSLKFKKFNYNIPIAVLLFATLFVLAYNKKNFLICILILAMFSALVYFTLNIRVGGKVYDIIGLLSTRMYLYISFISTIYVLGLTHNRVLFFIDVAAASLDLILTLYKKKCNFRKCKA